ncbi:MULTISPECIES: hypothetical protein [unclassified Streptomyces]|uniref:hypothetical protein n=1 Tax=unclassified Streptomyces TaxID=2593676 RepID=UPI001F04CF1C|nr:MULTISPECIES: hypothetical protein [unclassified Streptomyces]MCH0566875.1 hypothetical protein [Streptomyces sp. MUM 2J]MCH0569828.1 hypothetical protein [Streptomyces sp. MUM 136J]
MTELPLCLFALAEADEHDPAAVASSECPGGSDPDAAGKEVRLVLTCESARQAVGARD